MTPPEWVRESALGIAFTALLAVGRGLFNAGKRQREFENLKQDVADVRSEQKAQGKDLVTIREQVAEIHGMLKRAPRHEA